MNVCHLPRQVIECRPQAVNHITDDDTPADNGVVGHRDDADHVQPRRRVVGPLQTAGVGLVEGEDLVRQAQSMILSSFHLGPAPHKARMHRVRGPLNRARRETHAAEDALGLQSWSSSGAG